MKPKKFNGKLVLKKQTIANISNVEMNGLKGGIIPTISCEEGCTETCGYCNTVGNTSCPKFTICA